MHWLIVHVKQLLRRETLEFTAPDSPDLNPADYRVYGVMQEQVYHTPSQDVPDSRQRLMSVVYEAIDQ